MKEPKPIDKLAGEPEEIDKLYEEEPQALPTKRDGEFTLTQCPCCGHWSYILTAEGFCPWPNH